MGEAAKKLKKLLALGDETSDPLVDLVGYAEDVYGTMSGAYAAYGTAKSILTEFGLLENPRDPLQEIAIKIESLIKKIDKVLEGIDEILEKMGAGFALVKQWIDLTEETPMETALIHALGYINNPDSELDLNILVEKLGDSWDGIEYFADVDSWERLFAEDALYSDIWAGVAYPENTTADSDYVWDWMRTLPTYLRVLEWHTFVYLAAIEHDPSYQNSHVGNMEAFGKFLFEEVYQKILRNIKYIGPPSLEQMKYVIATLDDSNFVWHRKQGQNETLLDYDYKDPADGLPVRIEHFDTYGIDWLLENRIPGGRWRLAGYNYGAIERFSAYDSTNAYPLDELKAATSFIATNTQMYNHDFNNFSEFWWANWKVSIAQSDQFQVFYAHFLLRHGLRMLRQRNRIYNELGLPKVYATIKHYYSLLNLPVPEELEAHHTHYTSWSVREVRTLFPPGIGGVNVITPPVSAGFSLRGMAKIMEPWATAASNTISLRQLFLIEEELIPLE